MSVPSKVGAAVRWRRSLGASAAVAVLLLGCQPQMVPVNSAPNPAAPTRPTVPSKSRATAADSTKVSATAAAAPNDAVAAASQGQSTDAGKPPDRPVTRRPAAPGEPLEISFDDLVIGMRADVVYRPWMLTERAKEIDGQKVRLVGYVHAGVDKQKHITELVLLRNLECKFGPGGQADHLVMIKFKPGVEATFTKNAVEVQGVLKVNPWVGADGNTWSIYDLEGIAFKDLRRK